MGAVIGFTGTRWGMTPFQVESLTRELERLAPSVFHHGRCRGADEQAHHLVRQMFPACRIVGHPASGVNPRFVSDVECDELVAPGQPLARNRVIVEAADCLVATPAGPDHGPGGTWYTIRHGRKVGKEVTIIMPNGAFFV